MIGLTSLEVQNCIFNITEENNKFKLYTDNFHEFLFQELKEELEGILNISDLTPYHLQHKIIGPRIFQAYKKLRAEKSSTDGYIILLMGYARSSFRDFGGYHRIVVGLDGDDFQLILKQHSSNFVTYEMPPGFHSIEDVSKVVYTMGDHEGTLRNEYDDVSLKTKLISTRF